MQSVVVGLRALPRILVSTACGRTMADVGAKGAALSVECVGMEKKEEEKEEASPKQATLYEPKPLQHIALQSVTDHIEEMKDLRGLGPDVTGKLFHQVLMKGKLSYKLALLFESCEDDLVVKCMSEMSLLDGVPSTNTSGRYCR